MNFQSAIAYNRLKQIHQQRLNYDREMNKVQAVLGYKPAVENKKNAIAVDILLSIHQIL